jgi:hypothetical protein
MATIDVETLSLVATPKPKPQRDSGVGTYVKLPDMWREELIRRRATAADWAIALELLALARWSYVVKLTNDKAAKLGFCPRTRRRVLKRLAEWSLIKLEVRRGRSPRVSMKWLAGRQPGSHVG